MFALRGSDGKGRPFEMPLFPSGGGERRLRFRLTRASLMYWPVFALSEKGGSRYIDRATKRLVHTVDSICAQSVGRLSFKILDIPLEWFESMCHLTLRLDASGWITATITTRYGKGSRSREQPIAQIRAGVRPSPGGSSPERAGRVVWRRCRRPLRAQRPQPCAVAMKFGE